jgi:hypothetical protein
MHLVQLGGKPGRRVAIVREPHLILLRDAATTIDLVERSLSEGCRLSEIAEQRATEEAVSYDEVWDERSPWKLLAPVDCPGNPQRILVSGTGLTHLGSARERQAMHAAASPEEEAAMTDSMKMFEWGRQKGRPAPGTVGIAPEWFYKGDGSVLRGPFATLQIPGYAEDGGEEAEIAAVYYVAADGTPWRVGMMAGNEFSDHVFERRNYLNLAGSKLRTCSIGPEMVVDAAFEDVAGRTTIRRAGQVLWQEAIRTGEVNMCHSLGNLEHHHFKFAGHRQPGMLHVHFMGADRLSFGEGIRLEAGDEIEVAFEGFGRPLRNSIAREEPLLEPVRVQAMR